MPSIQEAGGKAAWTAAVARKAENYEILVHFSPCASAEVYVDFHPCTQYGGRIKAVNHEILVYCSPCASAEVYADIPACTQYGGRGETGDRLDS